MIKGLIITLILIGVISITVFIFSFFFKQGQLFIPTVKVIPTIKTDKLLSLSPTKTEILKQKCRIYPNPTDVIKYNLPKTSAEYCATCGDGICDYIEKCLPSHPMTTDCAGGLFCQKDCK